MSSRGNRLTWCALAGAFGCVTLVFGCALFTPSDTSPAIETHRPLLPPLRAAAGAVQLQVIFVERPAEDPLVTQLVWQEVDEVGVAAPPLRAVLHENGLRIGQCGASVPPALQTLLGFVTEVSSTDTAAMSGRQLSLLSGQDTEVVVCDSLETCTVRYVLNAQEDAVEFQHARGLFRLRPVRLQDGWVRLEFTPEIHHGESRMRHTPTDEGWALRAGQKADVRYQLKFQVTLNSGEMVIVGASDSPADTLGQTFFRHEQSGRINQRLLVIRVADAGRDDPSSATDP